jgi:hypothetical protein
MEAKSGNEFLRKVVKIILDESRIVGNGSFMKENHKKLLDFKYPKELEVYQVLRVFLTMSSNDYYRIKVSIKMCAKS